mmetsp:Transcript_27591/g.88566  ORF Transcript_27591/g.88566 Transcript_27591/m.88566 type:complete len:227 (-) Transcript_27591:464-1144(-)
MRPAHRVGGGRRVDWWLRLPDEGQGLQHLPACGKARKRAVHRLGAVRTGLREPSPQCRIAGAIAQGCGARGHPRWLQGCQGHQGHPRWQPVRSGLSMRRTKRRWAANVQRGGSLRSVRRLGQGARHGTAGGSCNGAVRDHRPRGGVPARKDGYWHRRHHRGGGGARRPGGAREPALHPRRLGRLECHQLSQRLAARPSPGWLSAWRASGHGTGRLCGPARGAQGEA